MNSALRTLFAVLAVLVAMAIVISGLCLAFSMAGLGVSFVTLSRISILGLSSPRIILFHPLKLVSYMIKNPHAIGRAYMTSPFRFLAPFFAGGISWTFLRFLLSHIMRLFQNRKTVLHGSAKWATEDELEDAGLLGKTGVVLGQTYDAEYEGKNRKKPKRKKGESEEDFRERKNTWTAGKDYELEKQGKLIMQSGNQHTLIVGSTRSGKGVGCIIPTAFKWPESIIIFDPKEENWQITAARRSEFSYTFKFQPENPSESIHYNPLLSIRRGVATMPDIQNLCLSLIALNEQSKDPFWDNEARKLLAAVIGYVIYCMPPDRKTFREVYSIFTSDDGKEEQAIEGDVLPDESDDRSTVQKRLDRYADNTARYMDTALDHLMMSDELYRQYNSRFSLSDEEREKVEKAAEGRLMKEDIDNLDRIKQDLVYFAGCEQKQLSSVVSTMMSNLQVIADPNVQAITDRSDFTMEDFLDGIEDDSGKRRPMSLYLCTSLASMQRLMPIMKIFYEQAITLLTRELKTRPYRLLLVFDEFRQMGKMDIVEKALALSAGYGVLCMIVIQSYDQLKTIYQSDALFTDNFAYQVVLRVNDPSTCKKIEEMLGQSTERHSKMNTSGNIGEVVKKHESYDLQELGRSLMTAEEVRTMREDEEVIIASGMHPYRAKKVRYYLDGRFTPLYRSNKGKGSQLPSPDLNDNYPHPEVMIAGKNGRLIPKDGLDREGWHLLLGFGRDITASSGDAVSVRNRNDSAFLKDETEIEKQSDDDMLHADNYDDDVCGDLEDIDETVLMEFARYRETDRRKNGTT